MGVPRDQVNVAKFTPGPIIQIGYIWEVFW